MKQMEDACNITTYPGRVCEGETKATSESTQGRQ